MVVSSTSPPNFCVKDRGRIATYWSLLANKARRGGEHDTGNSGSGERYRMPALMPVMANQ